MHVHASLLHDKYMHNMHVRASLLHDKHMYMRMFSMHAVLLCVLDWLLEKSGAVPWEVLLDLLFLQQETRDNVQYSTVYVHVHVHVQVCKANYSHK